MKAQRAKMAVAAALLVLLSRVGLLASTRAADTTAITAENWGKAVGFEPDLDSVPVKPGQTIDKSNVSTVKGHIPDGLERLVRDYNLSLRIVPYAPKHPSLGYIASTNQNRGKTVVNDVGSDFRKSGRNGLFAGLPFPHPKNGPEVATNFIDRYVGDDYEVFYDVIWTSAKSGVEYSEYWHLNWVRINNRTDLDPKPRIEELADNRAESLTYTEAIEPYDKKGLGALYWRSYDPVDLQGHLYIPPLRRVLRNSFGTRGDAWNGTDLLYEDAYGYWGAVEWMNWKLEGQRTMLMPAHPGIENVKNARANYDLDHWPHWNPILDWEARPVYVLSATPRIPDYPYSRMLMVVDAETYVMYYKEAFDKKGKLWKVHLVAPTESPDPDSQPDQILGIHAAIDLQAEHATCFHPRKFRANVDPDLSNFTVHALRKRGH